MDLIALALLVPGLILLIIGGFWFLVAAFRVGVLWGLACLFIPIVQFFFLIVHWDKAKRPFFLQLLGLAMIIASYIIDPQTLHHYGAVAVSL